jgi:hypothetical protein
MKLFKLPSRTPVLRPHLEYVEARRLAQRFGKRKPDLKAAAELITKDTVMSRSEIKKTAKVQKGILKRCLLL